MSDSTFIVNTIIKDSTISGKGRFFNQDLKKGTIIRKQEISPSSKSLLKFDNEHELSNYIYLLNGGTLNNELFLEKLIEKTHFFHTVPCDSEFYKNSVFLNEPYMFTNHSHDPNIEFIYTKDWKYTITCQNVKRGDEIVQSYLNFSKIDWFENFLNKYKISSCREFALKLK